LPEHLLACVEPVDGDVRDDAAVPIDVALVDGHGAAGQ
jgi:hypothetical protein